MAQFLKRGSLLCAALAVLMGCQTTQSGTPSIAGVYQDDTLRTVKERGVLHCGVSELDGFSSQGGSRVWRGLDADICRAIAVAALGSEDRVSFVPLSAQRRFKALQSGEVDILARHTTWTLTRDAALGVDFVGPNFVEGMSVLVRRDLGVSDVREMDGASYCLEKSSLAELYLAKFYFAQKIQYRAVVFDTIPEMIKGLASGQCDATILDSTGLAHQMKFMNNAKAFKILPQRLSFEPLALGVRQNDYKWLNFVRAVLSGVMLAEEAVSGPQYNALMEDSRDIAVSIDTYTDWLHYVVSRVGDYGEIYERHFGAPPTPFSRGANRLALNGGMMVPFRIGDLVFARPHGESTAQEVYQLMRERGYVRCGVVKEPGEPAASAFRSRAAWKEYSVEACRTYAAALFQNPDKIKVFHGYLDEQLKALTEGEIDMIGSPVVRDLRLISFGFDQPVTSFLGLQDKKVMGMGPVILPGSSIYSDSLRWAMWARLLYGQYHNDPGWAKLLVSRADLRAEVLNFKKGWLQAVLQRLPSIEGSLGEKLNSPEIFKLNATWHVGGAQYSAPMR